jgi:hypothetical protein
MLMAREVGLPLMRGLLVGVDGLGQEVVHAAARPRVRAR